MMEAPRTGPDEALVNLSVRKTQLPERVENEKGIIDVKSTFITTIMEKFHWRVK